jgi:hypothetical protein
LRVKKILSSENDPLDALVRYCEDHPPDLLVLATHQREGLARWLHKPVAEPLARRSRAMTLFVPTHGAGFVAPVNGAVTLRRVLIPVDHQPNAQVVLEESYFLATGFDCPSVKFRLLHVGTERGMPTLYLPHHPALEVGGTIDTRRSGRKHSQGSGQLAAGLDRHVDTGAPRFSRRVAWQHDGA